MQHLRISAVSYLNSKPFLNGLKHSSLFNTITLSLDSPSVCAQKLLDKQADIGLVPVAILPLLKNYKIIGDYCIGAVGMVNSVKLYSEVPLKEIENIWLDYQSRTSVALTRVLAKNYWHIKPIWLDAEIGYENKIKDKTAGVVIGDRTFELNGNFKYEYDLSEQWYQFSQLPFVFACWVTTKDLPSEFITAFNEALSIGVKSISSLSAEITRTGQYKTDVFTYLNQYISYKFDNEKQKGLNLFLKYLNQE